MKWHTEILLDPMWIVKILLLNDVGFRIKYYVPCYWHGFVTHDSLFTRKLELVYYDMKRLTCSKFIIPIFFFSKLRYIIDFWDMTVGHTNYGMVCLWFFNFDDSHNTWKSFYYQKGPILWRYCTLLFKLYYPCISFEK